MSEGVSINHPDYESKILTIEYVKDAYEGADAIKLDDTIYLKQPCGMSNNMYCSTYKFKAVYPEVVSKTHDGLMGLIFKKDATHNLEDVENITNKNESLNHLARNVVSEYLLKGCYGLFVDYIESKDEARILEYAPENIVNWKRNECGELNLVVIEELIENPDNDIFEHDVLESRRVLQLDENGYYFSSLYYKSGESWELQETYYPTSFQQQLDFIPFYILGGEKPLLIELARLAAKYYEGSADYYYSLHLTALATPYIKGGSEIANTDYDFYGRYKGQECQETGRYLGGDDDYDLTISFGGDDIIILPENGEVGFAEVQGNGLAEMRTSLDMIASQMVAMGAKSLKDNTDARVSEGTAKIQQGSHTASLFSVVYDVNIAIKQVIEWVNLWNNGLTSETDIEFSLNKEFHDITMTAQELTALVQGWQSGAITGPMLNNRLRQTGYTKDSDSDIENQRNEQFEEAGLAGLGFENENSE